MLECKNAYAVVCHRETANEMVKCTVCLRC